MYFLLSIMTVVSFFVINVLILVLLFSKQKIMLLSLSVFSLRVIFTILIILFLGQLV